MEKLKLKPSSYLKGFIDEIVKKINQLVSTSNELEAHKATANPTLSGEEATLTGLEIGTTDYALPPVVTANPVLAGTESNLTGLEIGDTKYAVEVGTNVVANPTGTASESLSKIEIGGTKYNVGGSLYRHSFSMTCTFGGLGTLDVFGDIITSSNTAFTITTLATYLFNNYSNYGIVGGAIDSVEDEYQGSAEILFNLDDDSLAVRYASSQANASNIGNFFDSVHAI